MVIYFAPMEGITDGILRQTHNRIFGGIDVYCLPFHKLTQSLSLLTREIRDISPKILLWVCRSIPSVMPSIGAK